MRVLGWDDWLIYARADNGDLLYSEHETDPLWLDAPHRGEAVHFLGASQCEDLKARVDNSWYLAKVLKHPSRWVWTKETEWDLGGLSDDEFMEQSRRRYLCD